MASITALTVTLTGVVGTNIQQVQVDGTVVTINPDRTWSTVVSAPAAGASTLVAITTFDDAGRSKTRTVTVERLLAAPV